MLSEGQEEKAREIAEDIAERAAEGEFGWCYGINGGISWEKLQEMRENTPPLLHLVDGMYMPIKED